MFLKNAPLLVTLWECRNLFLETTLALVGTVHLMQPKRRTGKPLRVVSSNRCVSFVRSMYNTVCTSCKRKLHLQCFASRRKTCADCLASKRKRINSKKAPVEGPDLSVRRCSSCKTCKASSCYSLNYKTCKCCLRKRSSRRTRQNSGCQKFQKFLHEYLCSTKDV